MPHVAPTCNEKRRSDIEACASGIQKLATGTWRRELIISPQPCLAELIISSRHFCVAAGASTLLFFVGKSSSRRGRCIWHTQARRGTPAGGNHKHEVPVCNKSHIPIAAVAGRTHQLTAAAFWRTVGNAIPEHARMGTDRGPSVASTNTLRSACHAHSSR